MVVLLSFVVGGAVLVFGLWMKVSVLMGDKGRPVFLSEIYKPGDGVIVCRVFQGDSDNFDTFIQCRKPDQTGKMGAFRFVRAHTLTCNGERISKNSLPPGTYRYIKETITTQNSNGNLHIARTTERLEPIILDHSA